MPQSTSDAGIAQTLATMQTVHTSAQTTCLSLLLWFRLRMLGWLSRMALKLIQPQLLAKLPTSGLRRSWSSTQDSKPNEWFSIKWNTRNA